MPGSPLKVKGIGQGRENAKKFLKENAEIAREIENRIRQNAGLVATAMLEGNENEEESPAESAETAEA